MEGLEKFREAFEAYSENYVIIGGTACDIAMTGTDSAALIALKSRAYLNLMNDKVAGKNVNSRDIKKHRSDVLKNVVIMEEDQVVAPASIVSCVKEFVASVRKDWEVLSESLSKVLDQDAAFVEALLAQLDEMFIAEQ